MAYMTTPPDALLKWKRTLEESPWRSTHFVIAILFNVLVFFNIFHSFHLQGHAVNTNFSLSFFTVCALVFLCYADFLVWKIIRRAKTAHLLHRNGLEDAALSISYLGFRVYIILLGVLFTLIAVLNSMFS